MKPKTKTIMFIVGSFIIGLLCGWIVNSKQSFFLGKRKEKKDFMKIIAEKLHLDSLQVKKVDSILISKKDQMEELKNRFLSIRDSIRTEIRGILSEEQTRLFDEFNAEFDKREAEKHKK